MVNSAEFGAASIASLAREERLVAEAQVSDTVMETDPTVSEVQSFRC